MDNGKRNTIGKLSGAALALAAASLFASGAVAPVAMADEAKVHCTGVNSCKGKGWVSMTEKQCTDKGGKVAKS